jgi:hypothetical protein
MKLVRGRHTGKLGLALVVALVMTMSLATLGSASPSAPQSPDIPNLPHFFHGSMATDQGIALQQGALVEAKRATGSWTGTASTTADSLSQYGYDTGGFYVPGEDSGLPGSGARPGDKIAFYVMGVRARLYNPVTKIWSDTIAFESGGYTELNLSAPISYTITATAGTGGTITPGGAVKVSYGFTQTFTIAANAGYTIGDVVVDGVSQGPITSYKFTQVMADHAISASFNPTNVTITATAGPGGAITPSGAINLAFGATQTFTITPNVNFAIQGVLVDGVPQGRVSTYTFSNVRADHTIAAAFGRPVYLPYISR